MSAVRDPLALSARELVRIAVVVVGIHADPVHELLGPSLAVPLGMDPVDRVRLADRRADAAVWVQRPIRVGDLVKDNASA